MAANFELQKEASLRKHATAIMLELFPEHHLQERLLGAVWARGPGPSLEGAKSGKRERRAEMGSGETRRVGGSAASSAVTDLSVAEPSGGVPGHEGGEVGLSPAIAGSDAAWSGNTRSLGMGDDLGADLVSDIRHVIDAAVEVPSSDHAAEPWRPRSTAAPAMGGLSPRQNGGRSVEPAGADAPGGGSGLLSMQPTAPDQGVDGGGGQGTPMLELDGRIIGQLLGDRLGRDASRPGSGTTFFDPRQSPAWTPSGSL